MSDRLPMDEPQDQIADVLAPVAVDTAYSYRVPRGLTLEVGDFVTVPLGAREATGVVWSLRNGPGGNLKAIADKRDLPTLAEPLRNFVDWVARWTLAPRGMVLRMGFAGASHGCRSVTMGGMAFAVFVAIGIFQWPLVPVVLVAAPISVALAWPRGERHDA